MQPVNSFSSFIALVVTTFMVFNSIGMVPVFVTVLGRYERKRQIKIIFRELVIALITLSLFIFFGSKILDALRITQSTIGIVGGILLFLIAISLIFPKGGETEGLPKHEPMIVPLAIPGLAGPGSIAAMMVFSENYGLIITLSALVCAWIPSLLLILSSSIVKKFLGEKGLQAVERLGGMIICLIGLDMLTKGIIMAVKENFVIGQ